MRDWFIGLTDTNKIAFLGSVVVPIIIAVLVKFNLRKKYSGPVLHDPTVNYNGGLTQEDFEKLSDLLNKNLEPNKQGTNTVNILTNLIKDYSTDSKNDKQIIAGLTEEVNAQAERIKNILNDEIITKDVKALISAGQIIEAEKLVDNASIEQEDKKLAAVHYEQGRVKELRLKYDQAKESFGKAAVLQPENTTYLNAFASILYYLAEYDKAIGYFEVALASDLATFGEAHPDVARERNNLGSAWESKGDYDKAIGYYELALASGLATFGEDHPSVATTRNNLGSAWNALGEYGKATGYLEQALASDLATFWEDHPSVAIRRNNLGSAWESKGEYDKAIEYYEQALATMKKVFGDHHPSTQTVQRNLERAQNEQ